MRQEKDILLPFLLMKMMSYKETCLKSNNELVVKLGIRINLTLLNHLEIYVYTNLCW